jgi:hypothetical protein
MEGAIGVKAAPALDRTAEEIRKKRITQEVTLLGKMNPQLFSYSTSESDTVGTLIYVDLKREAFNSADLLDDGIEIIKFQIRLGFQYPFLDP